jgi:hypothetical protein
MTTGTLVGNLCQDTSTTTGTGALTLANTVPAGAAAGSTTFANGFASTIATNGYPINNIFYYVTDGSNVEVGLGTLTSATNLTRDYVLLTQVPSGTQAVDGQLLSWAAGTKSVYSNPSLYATTAALWQRYPNQINGNDAGYTEDIMSGSFTAALTINSVGTNLTARYKISNAGIATIYFPATTATQAGTGVTITGIPAFLSQVTTQSGIILIQVNSVNTIGTFSIAAGASPSATGTLTLSQFSGVAPFAQTATWTASQPNGVQSGSISYPLI